MDQPATGRNQSVAAEINPAMGMEDGVVGKIDVAAFEDCPLAGAIHLVAGKFNPAGE